MTYIGRQVLTLTGFMTVILLGACNHHTLEHRQVHFGTNAPDEEGVQMFASKSELDASKLKELMGASQYSKLVAEVNFNQQLIIVAYGGPRMFFSGKMEIAEVYKYTGVKVPPINVRVRFGSAPQPCAPGAAPAPFAVAMVNRPELFSSMVGYEMQDFKDPCN